MRTAEIRLHRTEHGTFHAAPDADEKWSVHDTRGYLDSGPSCDECDACDCETDHDTLYQDGEVRDEVDEREEDCIGLSFAYVCLDGGDTLCKKCADKIGVEIVPCTCT